MAFTGQPDPAAVRMHRLSFLASLGRSISPPGGGGHDVVDSTSDEVTIPPKKRRRLLEPVPSHAVHQLIPSPFQLTRVVGLSDSENVNTVSLSDILGNPLIREAWIFNYCFDVDWTMQHFDSDIRHSVMVKIIHGSWKYGDGNRQRIDDACRRWPNIDAIQAYLPDAFGTHHTKMIVLFRHDEVAEIIIHTANMQAGDWTHATQAVWRSPVLPELSATSIPLPDLSLGSGARFKWDFLRYLRAYNEKVGPLIQQISKYDFRSIRGALVGSVPSRLKNVYNANADKESWGHPAMFHALNRIGQTRLALRGAYAVSATGSPHIICQCSSVATLKAGWLQDTLLQAVKALQPNAKHTLSIVYPTAPNIAASLAGYGCGPSIHMKIQTHAHQKQVAALRPHLCKWSGGDGVKHAFREFAAPHIKTYISFESKPTATNASPAINWALLTSANLSIQAWGTEAKMPTEKSKTKSQFDASEAEVHIQSYELGVLVWPELWADVGPGARCAMMPTFGKDMPDRTLAGQASIVVGLRMPYDLPLTEYAASDDPWSSHTTYSERDRHGRTWPPEESQLK